MVEYSEKLNDLGHHAIIHPMIIELAEGKNPELQKKIDSNHSEAKKQHGFIKWYYNAIANSDAILVLNFDKNGIKNYVGGNTLMEIGFAHVNDKKVFLLNPVPESSYKQEILAMLTKVINGNLKEIK